MENEKKELVKESNIKRESLIKVNKNIKARENFCSVCSNIVVIITFLLFGYIALMSMFYTNTIDPNDYVGENILQNPDSFALNVIVMCLFIGLLFLLRPYADVFKKAKSNVLYICLSAYVLIIGFLWIFSSYAIPSADTGAVYDSMVRFSKGDYSTLFSSSEYYGEYYGGASYFACFPYQLGYVLFGEILFRILPTQSFMLMQSLNVFAVVGIYLGLLKISEKVFNSQSVTFILTFLLGAELQPIFFSTFVYGNLLGECLSVWAIYFVIKYMKEDKFLYLVPSSLLMASAVIIKYNNMIFLLTLIIVLLLHSISKKKIKSILALIMVAVVTAVGSAIPASVYKARSKADLSKSVPQSAFLSMGLDDSGKNPGWYTYHMVSLFLENNYDPDLADKDAKERIKQRLSDFKDNPSYAFDFFNKKTLSQWNEPTYESIWVSKVRGHEKELGTFADSVYNKQTGKLIEGYMNFYQQFIFIMFCVGVLALIRKKNKLPDIIIMIGILGGYFYHFLFEAKSQYILNYFILMTFYSAYGVYFMLKPHSFEGLKKFKFFEKIKKAVIWLDEKSTRESN